ncbi:hypothetical protein J6590_097112 [Homalodisca vitripennis]|nr:hypothetical protein J6590_097112 [Homalodisca vitripennis]
MHIRARLRQPSKSDAAFNHEIKTPKVSLGLIPDTYGQYNSFSSGPQDSPVVVHNSVTCQQQHLQLSLRRQLDGRASSAKKDQWSPMIPSYKGDKGKGMIRVNSKTIISHSLLLSSEVH